MQQRDRQRGGGEDAARCPRGPPRAIASQPITRHIAGDPAEARQHRGDDRGDRGGAGGGERRASGRARSGRRATMPPVASPAATRSADARGERVEVHRLARRRARPAPTRVMPNRSSVAGSTRPPSSDRSSSSSSSALRSCASVGRNSGRGSSAASIARPSSFGQVAAARAQRRQVGAQSAGGGDRAVAAHRVHAGPALVEHQRERVDVGGLGHALALGLLGRHVGERADDVAGARERVADREVGDAEVGELGEAGAGRGLGDDDHVLRLDVAVDDLLRVRVRERVAHRHADLGDVAVGQRAAAVRSANVRPWTSSETR